MGLRQPSAIRSQLLGIPRRYFALIRDLAIPSFRENRVSRIRSLPRIHESTIVVVSQNFLNVIVT